MTIKELVKILNAKIINIIDENESFSKGYAGDFLSFVIGNAPTECAWFTVMNNINVCAVATLAEVTVIVLCENVEPEDSLISRVKQQNANLIVTKYDIFGAIKKVSSFLED